MRSGALILILRVLLFFPALCIAAEARTLTAADGRSIEVEVLGFEGLEKVKIKREDTGQTFTLAIDSFAESDRAALRAEARAEAAKPPPPPGDRDIVIELSRKAKSGKTSKWPVAADFTDGSRRDIGSVNVTDALSSYAIVLVNRTQRAFDGLRVDYVLFAETDARKDPSRTARVTTRAGTAPIALLRPYARETLDSEPIPTRKTTLSGQATWAHAGGDRTPIELKGIWLRIYQGDTLVIESSTPDTLARDNSWAECFTARLGQAPAPVPFF